MQSMHRYESREGVQALWAEVHGPGTPALNSRETCWQIKGSGFVVPYILLARNKRLFDPVFKNPQTALSANP
jgi:hypothetical protein